MDLSNGSTASSRPASCLLHNHWVNWQTTDHLSGPTKTGAYGQPSCPYLISVSIFISACIFASGCTSGCPDNWFWTPCPLARPTGLLTFCVCTCCMLYFIHPAPWGGVYVVCCINYICIFLTLLLFPVMHHFIILSIQVYHSDWERAFTSIL